MNDDTRDPAIRNELAKAELKALRELPVAIALTRMARWIDDAADLVAATAKIAELENDLLRLRWRAGGWEIAHAAKDAEIERLRLVPSESFAVVTSLRQECDEALAEIKRLNHALNRSLNDREIDAAGLGQTIIEQRAEIAALKAEMTRRDEFASAKFIDGREEIGRLRAEIDRLNWKSAKEGS